MRMKFSVSCFHWQKDCRKPSGCLTCSFPRSTFLKQHFIFPCCLKIYLPAVSFVPRQPDCSFEASGLDVSYWISSAVSRPRRGCVEQIAGFSFFCHPAVFIPISSKLTSTPPNHPSHCPSLKPSTATVWLNEGCALWRNVETYFNVDLCVECKMERERKGFVNTWMDFFLSSPPLRALVFIAHGAGEHCGPYDEIAQKLKEVSLLVFAHDHGEWPDTHRVTLMPVFSFRKKPLHLFSFW